VEGGKFSTYFNLKDANWISDVKGLVSIGFWPIRGWPPKQPDEIYVVFGEHGENIKGSLTKEFGSIKTAELIYRFTWNLTIKWHEWLDR